MALKGNLRDFTITQLLNLINLAKKTGSLVIEGPGEIAQVTFREGKLAYAQIGVDARGGRNCGPHPRSDHETARPVVQNLIGRGFSIF